MAVQQTQALPPQYVEDLQKDLGTQLTALTAAPLATDKFAPTVAGQDPAQQAAYQMATTQGQGIGAFQPYITQAGAYDTAAAGLSGAGAYQPFMSPYQSQVIDATLSEFDKQRLGGEQSIRDQAVMSGNFGGGREGAQLGQYQADSLADRSALQASMLQQGFSQANQLAQQNFMNQGSIGAAQQGLAGAYGNQMNQQFGLSDFGRTGMGQDVSALGSLGGLRQGMTQANLSADQQAAQTGAYEPYGRLSQYGNTLTGLAGGVAGSQYQDPGSSNPFQTALGTATGLAGLFGKIYG